MKINDLLKILEGDISLIEKVDISDVALYQDRVIIYPKTIKKILQNYLSGQLRAEELNSWAEFICARSEYTSPEYLDDEKAIYYEDMWYVIQKISTPEIDGELTFDRVKQYLKELEKYPD